MTSEGGKMNEHRVLVQVFARSEEEMQAGLPDYDIEWCTEVHA